MFKLLTLEDYSMGRDLLFPEEWKLIKSNAQNLLDAVNGLFIDLNYDRQLEVSSGYRPFAVNITIPNAAKKSLHQQGLAIDLRDADGYIKEILRPGAVLEHAALLRKYDLFMEHPKYCPKWCHLDMGRRPDRASRIFLP